MQWHDAMTSAYSALPSSRPAAPGFHTLAIRAFGIPYGSFFHSPFFLILLAWSLAATVVGRRSPRAMVWLGLLWAGCAITHPLLDALTDGGSGVMLLFPFSEDRWFFPWRPIRVSPLSIPRFFSRAGYILRSEMPFCMAAVAIGAAGWCVARTACGRRNEAAMTQP